jgi:nitrite reductase/ring-hydroxylating ferredoxin subunit
MKKIAELKDFETRSYKIIRHAGKEIAIFKVGSEFYAIENQCPHRQAPLIAGAIKGFVVECPWHGARFDLRTGTGLPGPHQADLMCFESRVEGDNLFLVE